MRRWALAAGLFIFVLVSFAWRTRDTKRAGTMLVMKFRSDDPASWLAFNDLIQFRGLKLTQAKCDKPTVCFLGFLPGTQKSLLNSRGLTFMEIAVERSQSESVFSVVFHKIFQKHIDVRKEPLEQVETRLAGQLKKIGIESPPFELTEVNGKLFVKLEDKSLQLSPPKMEEGNPQDVDNAIRKSDATVTAQPQKIKSLSAFDWILHSWKTRDSSVNSFHKWVKISGTSYRGFVIRLESPAQIEPGYFLYQKSDSVFLARNDNKWRLQEMKGGEFIFSRDKDAFPTTILWIPADKYGWRFELRRGSLKDQTYLFIDDSRNRQLDSVLKIYKSRNSGLFEEQ